MGQNERYVAGRGGAKGGERGKLMANRVHALTERVCVIAYIASPVVSPPLGQGRMRAYECELSPLSVALLRLHSKRVRRIAWSAAAPRR